MLSFVPESFVFWFAIKEKINNKIHRNNFPVVLYRCETWSLTLREEHRLRVFENRVLRRIFGSKMDEVTGSWRRMYKQQLHALYNVKVAP